mmetsp:Transcript_7954/g.15346  ORF Transcript_7954/g.15346 Transcript_7954/m.15346 type:complete len:255 (+) Transcript_7954:2639-3403(+)
MAPEGLRDDLLPFVGVGFLLGTGGILILTRCFILERERSIALSLMRMILRWFASCFLRTSSSACSRLRSSTTTRAWATQSCRLGIARSIPRLFGGRRRFEIGSLSSASPMLRRLLRSFSWISCDMTFVPPSCTSLHPCVRAEALTAKPIFLQNGTASDDAHARVSLTPSGRTRSCMRLSSNLPNPLRCSVGLVAMKSTSSKCVAACTLTVAQLTTWSPSELCRDSTIVLKLLKSCFTLQCALTAACWKSLGMVG